MTPEPRTRPSAGSPRPNLIGAANAECLAVAAAVAVPNTSTTPGASSLGLLIHGVGKYIQGKEREWRGGKATDAAGQRRPSTT
jgi:hypothetical protein